MTEKGYQLQRVFKLKFSNREENLSAIVKTVNY
jgi:hypothetical protein